MLSTASPTGRALLVAGLLLIGLSACGRRGALEPPPTAAAPTTGTQARAQAGTAQVDDDEPETLLPSVSPAPASSPRDRRRGYTIPKEPFILDPLL